MNANLILNKWYHRLPGKLVLQAEATALAQELPTLFGFHIVQLGGPLGTELLDSSPILHKVRIGAYMVQEFSGSSLQSDFTSLPLAPNSVDVVIVSHVLEYFDNPAEILQQVYMSLVPEGHVIVLCFNPMSLMGLQRKIFGQHNNLHLGNMRSSYRVQHWLVQAGFHLEKTSMIYFRPPIKNETLTNKLEFMENIGHLIFPFFGAVTMLVAKKRIVGATTITADELRAAKKLPNGMPEISSRWSEQDESR